MPSGITHRKSSSVSSEEMPFFFAMKIRMISPSTIAHVIISPYHLTSRFPMRNATGFIFIRTSYNIRIRRDKRPPVLLKVYKRAPRRKLRSYARHIRAFPPFRQKR